jgi:alkanesulfonate monooxygenase SsuD/methylene tetrahydromethanopterin reductase-like flavin-dependent oxidoreductase (luciferase family)
MDDFLVGTFLSSRRADLTTTLANAASAEASGFDYVSVQDHPYVPELLDPFVLIGALAAVTDRLRFMPNVANLPMRPPPMLAKTVASLDVASHGRMELGLGGGRSWSAIDGLGGPRWQPGQVVAAIDEAITILRAMWQPGHDLDLTGAMYQVRAATGPAPAHDVGIWLGAAGPRMLDLLGRRADGWIAPVATPFETKAAAQARIDIAAESVGRAPTEIRRVIQLVAVVADSPTFVPRPRSGPNAQIIHADPANWAQIIAEFVVDERFDTVNIGFADESASQIERFGREVLPMARDEIARRRASMAGA